VIDGCGRLDVKHLIILRSIKCYRHSVRNNLFCALMSANCVYDNHMISVFTRDAAKNVYKKFQADLPD